MTAPAKSLMPYRHLGRTGLRVSALSFGSWVSFKTQSDTDQAYNIMKRAYEAGINFFDNAEVYANGDSEVIMGEVIKRGIKEGIWAREDLVVTTKIFFGVQRGDHPKSQNAMGNSRKHIVEGLTASLKRLQLDYVDVVFCHREDPATPIEETVRAMNHVIDRGLAFYWGTSEWPAVSIATAFEIANRLNQVGPCCEQPQYNILVRDRVELEYYPLYERYGLGLTIWSPLASGVLTGKYSQGIPEGSRLSLPDYKWLKDRLLEPSRGWLAAADKFVDLAKSLDVSAASLAVAWTVYNQRVSTVILGATSIAQLEENLEALNALSKLTPEVLKQINELFGAPKLSDTDQVVHTIRQIPSRVIGA